MDEEKSEEIFILECKYNIDINNIKEYKLDVTIDSISLGLVMSYINENFNDIHNKKLRLFNYFGIEILEDSDLKTFYSEVIRHKIIFFTKNNENFDYCKIMRLFKFVKKLGEGGFGKVFLAQQIISKEFFALKYIKPGIINFDVNFLYKEIEALKRLDHKNVIKLLSFCTDINENIILILEYASGGSLRDYLKQKTKLDEQEAKKIIKQILHTTNYCHDKGIVHRDLKFENILFKDENREQIKIIDFGISGIFNSEKITAGSIDYSPPEVVGGWDYESNIAIDIWSIGCMVFECISGEKIFQGKNIQEKKENIIQGRYLIPDYISNEASHLINQMLIKNAKERLGILDCLNHPWIKNQILDELSFAKIINKSRLRKQKNIEINSDKNENQNKVTKKKKVLIINTNIRSTSLGINQNKLISPSDPNFPMIPNSKMGRINSHSREKKTMVTKVDSNFEENRMFGYNLYLMKLNNGKLSNFMQPIGMAKDQKRKSERIKNLMIKYYDKSTINKSNDLISQIHTDYNENEAGNSNEINIKKSTKNSFLHSDNKNNNLNKILQNKSSEKKKNFEFYKVNPVKISSAKSKISSCIDLPLPNINIKKFEN